MSARRLEEILEECLSAYLDGRRSIEESLSLYPALAPDLEPLLRTVTQLNTTLGEYNPPRHVQQRGLNRFLSDARVRRDLKALEASGGRGWIATFFQKYRLGMAGAAMSVAVLAAVFGGAMLMGAGDSSEPQAASNPTAGPATPAAVINLSQAIANIRDKGTQVQKSDIDALARAARDVGATSAEDLAPVRDRVQQQLQDANQLLSDIAANQPEVAPEAQEAQGTVYQVAAAIGLPTPPAIVATSTPVPAATAPTVTPTPVPPTPSDTPAPTPTPTEAPTPTLPPPPSDSPPPRAPAGF